MKWIILKKSKWINVETKGLPKESGYYLFYLNKNSLYKGCNIRLGSIVIGADKKIKWFLGGDRVKNITHWMNLPEPPEEE